MSGNLTDVFNMSETSHMFSFLYNLMQIYVAWFLPSSSLSTIASTPLIGCQHCCFLTFSYILTWHDLHFAVPSAISARAKESFLWLVPDPRMDGEWPLLIFGHILPQPLHILWSGNSCWRADCRHGCSGNYHVHLHHLGCQHADCSNNEPFHMDSTSLCMGQHNNLVSLHPCLRDDTEVPWQLSDLVGSPWASSYILGSNASGNCCLQHPLPDSHILPEIMQSTWSPCDSRDQVPKERCRRPDNVEEGAVEGQAEDEDWFHR